MAEDQAATTAAYSTDSKKEDLPALVEKTLHGFVHPVPEGLIPVRGYEFGKDGVDYHALLQSYKTCGFQATNFGLAVEQIIQMVSAKYFACSNYVVSGNLSHRFRLHIYDPRWLACNGEFMLGKMPATQI